MTSPVIRVGEVSVRPLVSSRFRLDGGSMFGTVPRALWEKKAPPDELNRIPLNLNSLLIETGGVRILVEPGMGCKFDERWTDIYALGDCDIQRELDRLGVRPEDIDAVIMTHLHLDHAGGATVVDDSGKAVPAFPRARYYVQAEEWEEAMEPHPVEKASYLRADFEPLGGSGQVELLSGPAEIAPGITVEPARGHTHGHQLVRIRSGGEEALYLGDLVPTAAHLKPSWLMSWDLEPTAAYREKERILEDAAARGVLLFFSHDPEIAAAKVEGAGARSSDFRILPESVVAAEPACTP